MSSSSDPDDQVDLSKPAGDGVRAATPEEAPFDPYRFGAPDVPPPPEYAPPGYVPPAGSGMPPYPYGVSHGPSYGPAPYPSGGTPPYPGSPYPPPGYPAARGGNSKAVAGLILGIASIVLCWTTFVDVVVIVLAVIFSSLGLGVARARGGVGRGQAIAGLVCAGVGLVLAAVLTVFFVHAANQCGGIHDQGTPGFQQCIEDKL